MSLFLSGPWLDTPVLLMQVIQGHTSGVQWLVYITGKGTQLPGGREFVMRPGSLVTFSEHQGPSKTEHLLTNNNAKLKRSEGAHWKIVNT